MEFTKIRNESMKEEYYVGTHKSGLKMVLLPKKGQSSYSAYFGAICGSIDDSFRIEGESDFTDIPDGIAHFLEHKLFESEDLGAFERYAATGAEANAGTSFDNTTYYFSCSDKFYESLEILLDFVQSPYFTSETVLKEQGIIGQEIKMYQDSPDWICFFNLLGGMYYNNPIRKDIAGTVESISHITADMLYRCYNAFYNPANMVFAAVGDFDMNELAEFVDARIRETTPKKVETRPVNEPSGVREAYVERKMPVSQPLFSIGFKENDPTPGTEGVRKRVESKMILEILFGTASEFYCENYESGLINSGFYASYSNGRGFAFSSVNGESDEPEKVAEKVMECLSKAAGCGLKEDDVERARRKLFGKLANGFDNADSVAWRAISCELQNDGNIYTEFDMIEECTAETLEKRIKTHFTKENMTLSVIRPANKQE